MPDLQTTALITMTGLFLAAVLQSLRQMRHMNTWVRQDAKRRKDLSRLIEEENKRLDSHYGENN